MLTPSASRSSGLPKSGLLLPYRVASDTDPENGGLKPIPLGQGASPGEDLPFKIELWDQAKKAVEQVLAVTANGSIGYAAYFAATREYPDRYITLRHKNRTVARSHGPDPE
jgi:hypothetical protein